MVQKASIIMHTWHDHFKSFTNTAAIPCHRLVTLQKLLKTKVGLLGCVGGGGDDDGGGFKIITMTTVNYI